ncbi:hypothetical protein Tco_0060948 [Tanacetum coccineum]
MEATTNSIFIDEETMQYIKETVNIEVRKMFDDLMEEISGSSNRVSFSQDEKDSNAVKVFEEMPIQKILKQEGTIAEYSAAFKSLFESSETVDKDIDNEVLDEVSHPAKVETRECDIMVYIAQDTRSYHTRFTKI